MVINGLGIANVSNDRELTFKPSEMNWKIESSDNRKLEGTVAGASYVEVQPPGKSPWAVTMGIGDNPGEFSRYGQTGGIDSADAVVSGVVTFPIPPNSGTVLVNLREK